MWIADAQRSREIDRIASAEFGVPSRVLMERAGLAVFEVVRRMLPEGGRITVFCGKGNNGGDGFVVARHAIEAGYGVHCLVAADEDELTPEAAEQMHVARAQGVEPIFASDARWNTRADCLGCRDLVVDALLGTGARGAVQGEVHRAILAIRASGVPVVAVDIPSGIACDTGEELGDSVWALRTVTFGHAKPFLFQGIGLEHSGFWTVADIGYPKALLDRPTGARILSRKDVADLLPERLRASHKGDNGHVLVVAGSPSMPGAAVLAVRGALRAGAGLVTIAAPKSVCDTVSHHFPEALLLPLEPDDAHSVLLARMEEFDAAVFGPGLGRDSDGLLRQLLPAWQKPCCIDADALNAVSQGIPLPEGESVLTPHPGEMGRLLGRSAADVQKDRFRAARDGADALGKTILLKGAYSIIGQPGEPLTVNTTGNPGMAAGGMGDVLSGVVGTLLAQGLPAFEAASAAAYWHGAAGDVCADEIGTVGYTALDVANALPKARARIVMSCDG